MIDYSIDPREVTDWALSVHDAVFCDWGTVRVIEELIGYEFFGSEDVNPKLKNEIINDYELRELLYDYIINDEQRKKVGL